MGRLGVTAKMISSNSGIYKEALDIDYCRDSHC